MILNTRNMFNLGIIYYSPKLKSALIDWRKLWYRPSLHFEKWGRGQQFNVLTF